MIKKPPFKPSVSAETQFSRQLRKVARHSGHIVGIHIDGVEIRDEEGLRKALRDYSKLIEPWARRQAAKMLAQVSQANKRAMQKNSKQMGNLLKRTVAEANVGERAAILMAENVELIKSLPIRAGERAQKLAMEAVFNGGRADEIAEMLHRSGQVSESEAMTIARTEVARANASLNEARATAVGSQRYIWRNSGDSAVRPAHKTYHGHKLDGMLFAWTDPPTLDDGTRGHPGTFPNCRCYAEPVFDE